jgi:Icc-related predicted phosphoesterase
MINQPEQRPKLRIAAVADLHVHKIHHGDHRAMFADMSQRADVVVLCGDLTNLGLPEEAEHLASDMANLHLPTVAVLGNHDHHSRKTDEVKQAFRKVNVTFLDEDETFELGDVGFAGVKGFGGGFASHMLGSFGEDATKHFVSEAVDEALALEHALTRLATPKKIVLMHYTPIPQTAVGEPPEIFPFLGCSRFAETIDRFDVSAVFHGHAHHGQPNGQTPKGIPVYNCSLEVLRRVQGQPYVIVEI